MNKVTRYDYNYIVDAHGLVDEIFMEEDPEGPYISYEDYKKLEEELQRVREDAATLKAVNSVYRFASSEKTHLLHWSISQTNEGFEGGYDGWQHGFGAAAFGPCASAQEIADQIISGVRAALSPLDVAASEGGSR